MTLLAVTVIGQDRPGIIADATAALGRLGGNLEDSTMTLLRGHFAMVLLVQMDATIEDVVRVLAPIEGDGSLQVSVREVPAEADAGPLGSSYLLSVHGADRPGIVSALTAVVASVGGNVTDLSTRLTGDLYVLMAEVDLPGSVDLQALERRLRDAAAELGIDASLSPVEPDDL
jgi:glycine cleavage system transcriptional repressor